MDVNKLCPNCMNVSELDVCNKCGYDKKRGQNNTHALTPYAILGGKYLVGNVIGEGGFGITYIGYDLNLDVRIAIKEYYPNGFVTRESSVTNEITEYTSNNLEQYKKWKDSFVNEARNIAKFSNLSGIIQVRDFFQENNTAYIVMEYVEGETLKNYLINRGSVMSVGETLEMMDPVIKSLAKVHEAGIIHRDISPDNIMIQRGGNIKLIDFGAAREFESGNDRSLSVMLKPGYAPEEQYRTHGEQGPWTDVYALCATIYRCITGIKPLESMERMRDDGLKKPSELGVSIPPHVEAALMRGMSVFAENRTSDMKELHSELYKDLKSQNNSAKVVANQNNLDNATTVHSVLTQQDTASEKPLTSSKTRYCWCCGKELKGDSCFCSWCGKSQNMEDQKGNNPQKVDPRKKMKKILVIVAAILIPLILFEGVFIYTKNSSKSISNAEEAAISDGSVANTEKEESEKEVSLDETQEEFNTDIESAVDEGIDNTDINELSDNKEENRHYILPDSGKKELQESDLEDLSAWGLTLARNEIYARHGGIFMSDELNDYFKEQSWYEPEKKIEEIGLSKLETKNAIFILEYQKNNGLEYKLSNN